MYSPAEVPSSTRAAPAKKRIWSTIGGISSDSTSAFGLPVFSLSTATSCSARASIASAIFNSASWRSDGVVFPHDSNARSAAWQAASISCSEETADVANTSSVTGSTSSSSRPSSAAAFPSTKLVSVLVINSPLPQAVAVRTLPTPMRLRERLCGR